MGAGGGPAAAGGAGRLPPVTPHGAVRSTEALAREVLAEIPGEIAAHLSPFARPSELADRIRAAR
jgi:hypothetical protein